MPTYEREGASIHYEEHGEGFPVLLIAPGGMRSAIEWWGRFPWDPVQTLAGHFRVVAMDQRNAGRSSAPVQASDGWPTYIADQLGLMRHLGHERFLVLGCCIGGAFGMGLVHRAPERIAAAALMQPIGLSDAPPNRPVFYELFEGWAGELCADSRHAQHASVTPDTWATFRESMYGGEFLFALDRAEAATCTEIPLLILRGDDIYHPSAISEELDALLPNAELIWDWKEGEAAELAVEGLISFLQEHRPTTA